MKTSNKIIWGMLTFLVLFSLAILVVFWHTSAEPSTLVASVFAFCSIEGGILGVIKVAKTKKGENNETGNN